MSTRAASTASAASSTTLSANAVAIITPPRDAGGAINAVLDAATRTWTAEASSWHACAATFRAVHSELAAAQSAANGASSTGGAPAGSISATGGAPAGSVSGSGAGPAVPQEHDKVRFLKPAGGDGAGGATHEPWGGGAFPLWRTSEPACMLTVMLLTGFTEAAVAGQRRELALGAFGPSVRCPLRELACQLTLGLPLDTPGEVDAWAAKLVAHSPPTMSDAALADLRARLLACPGRNAVDGTLCDWVDGAAAFLPFSPQLSQQRVAPWMKGVPRGEWVPAPTGSGVPAGTLVLVVDVQTNKVPSDTAAVGALAAACPIAGSLAGQQPLLFHGTDWLGATSIFTHGIRVGHERQRSSCDFGNGFYMTPDFSVARNYSCQMQGAVIVFARAPHLERALSMTHPHAAPLPPPPLELQGTEGLCEWQQLVGAHYRDHFAVAVTIVGTSAVLTGPTSANPSRVAHYPPPGEAPQPSAEVWQVVVKTQQAAGRR